MKKISAAILAIVCFVLMASCVRAQDGSRVTPIHPYVLSVMFNKTTSLIFPYAISSVDRGSRDILIQKAIGVENVLQVKAARHDFTETSLTVITSDGSLYPYLVTYTDSTAAISLQFMKSNISPSPVAVFSKDATTDELALSAAKVISKERTIDNIKDKANEMLMEVKGIYVRNNTIYFQLHLCNNSAIGYDVQSLRFFIRDRKKSKRTASQEIEMLPEYILGNTNRIGSKSEQTVCVALSKFTIPDKKYLVVQMMEKDGGRNLSFKIDNNHLMLAKGI